MRARALTSLTIIGTFCLVGVLAGGLLTGCSADAGERTPGGPSGPSTGGDAAGDGGNSGSGDGGTGTGTGGASSGGADSGSGGTGGGASVDCSALPVCDDFEDGVVGQAPNPTLWSLRLNYDGHAPASSIVIDDTERHSGSQSVKVTASNSQTIGIVNTSAFPTDVVHLRAWMKVQLVPEQERDPVFIGVGIDENTEVRLRRFDGYVTSNNTDEDDIVPSEARTGLGCPSCTSMPTDWFCVQMYVNRPNEELSISIDGAPAVSLAAWQSGTTTMPPSLDQVRFGFLAANTSAGTVWYDDIAIGPEPIGCD